jgi:hypothetical protein
LLGYAFSRLLVEAVRAAMTTDGTVWLLSEHGIEEDLGVSLIVSVYALWIGGSLDIVARPHRGGVDVVLVSTGRRDERLPLLESDILDRVHARAEVRPRELVETLPFPSKSRGLGAWFFSGSPSQQAKGEGGWFAAISSFDGERPAAVERALDLAKSLVALETSTDLDDELERDRRDEVTFVLEAELFDALQRLP